MHIIDHGNTSDDCSLCLFLRGVLMMKVLTTQWSWRTAQGKGWMRRWSVLTTAVLVSAPPPSSHPPQIRITLSVLVLTISLDHQISRHLPISVSSQSCTVAIELGIYWCDCDLRHR